MKFDQNFMQANHLEMHKINRSVMYYISNEP